MQSLIKIREFEEDHVGLYDPGGMFLGVIKSQLSFYDVRIQIAKLQITGFYIIFRGEKYYFNMDGSLPIYPENLFDTSANLIRTLINIRTDRRK